MKRIARSLELSIAAHGALEGIGGARQRREALRGRGGVEGRVGLALDSLVAHFPRSADLGLSGLSRVIGGVSYIGHGSYVSVYRQDTQVLKVHRNTATMTPNEQTAYIRHHEEACVALAGHFGSIVTTTQSFAVETHPLGDYQVVVGRQAYVSGVPLDLFTTNTVDLNRDSVAEFCAEQPSGRAQLLDLVALTYASSEASHVVPDLNGSGNFRRVGLP